MISAKRIWEIVVDTVAAIRDSNFTIVAKNIEQAIKQALQEAEPLIRKNEREKVADWLLSDAPYRSKDASNRLREKE